MRGPKTFLLACSLTLGSWGAVAGPAVAADAKPAAATSASAPAATKSPPPAAAAKPAAAGAKTPATGASAVGTGTTAPATAAVAAASARPPAAHFLFAAVHRQPLLDGRSTSMREHHDQYSKEALSVLLRPAGPVEEQMAVKTDAQYVDIYFRPGPDAASRLGLLGLLGKLVDRPRVRRGAGRRRPPRSWCCTSSGSAGCRIMCVPVFRASRTSRCSPRGPS